MKFLAVFAAVCAVASASKGWTLTQLSSAVASPVTDAALKPVLSQALNQVMDNIFSQDDYVRNIFFVGLFHDEFYPYTKYTKHH